jgi:hypothetical protein
MKGVGKKGIQSNTLYMVLLLALIWIAAIFLINPLHDFPLNDDWSFGLTVKSLTEEGRYILNDWLASPFLTQALWGTLFCLPFGFSFNALMLSTVVIGWIGIMFTFLIFKTLTKDNFLAFIIALLILTNPLLLNLSVSFMMDLHFYGFFVTSLYFYILFYTKGKISHLAIGSMLALLATFSRQFGLVIPVGFLVYELVSSRRLLNRALLVHLLTTVLIFIFLNLYKGWLVATDNLPAYYRNMSDLFDVGVAEFGWRVFIRAGLLLLEGGLWLFPLLLLLTIRQWKMVRKSFVPLIILGILLIPSMIRTVSALPGGNVLYDFGLGPITTRDMFISGASEGLFSLPGVWFPVRIVAFTGGLMIIFLLSLVIQRLRSAAGSNETPGIFDFRLLALILILLYTGIIMINITYFDRYIIPLLPLLIMMILPDPGDRFYLKRLMRYSAPVFLTAFLIFGVLATRDYLNINRARWDVANELIGKGISPETIDGGHEFNGWHGKEIDIYGKWDTTGFEYVIAFSEIENHQAISKMPVKSWLEGRTYEVMLLKKPD